MEGKTMCSYIKMVAYELYKQDWINKHISKQELLDSKRDYYIYRASCEEGEEILYNEWLEEVGFSDGVYACFDEFCQMEYLRIEYIKQLLADKKLIDLYNKDVANNNAKLECK